MYCVLERERERERERVRERERESEREREKIKKERIKSNRIEGRVTIQSSGAGEQKMESGCEGGEGRGVGCSFHFAGNGPVTVGGAVTL